MTQRFWVSISNIKYKYKIQDHRLYHKKILIKLHEHTTLFCLYGADIFWDVLPSFWQPTAHQMTNFEIIIHRAAICLDIHPWCNHMIPHPSMTCNDVTSTNLCHPLHWAQKTTCCTSVCYDKGVRRVRSRENWRNLPLRLPRSQPIIPVKLCTLCTLACDNECKGSTLALNLLFQLLSNLFWNLLWKWSKQVSQIKKSLHYEYD